MPNLHTNEAEIYDLALHSIFHDENSIGIIFPTFFTAASSVRVLWRCFRFLARSSQQALVRLASLPSNWNRQEHKRGEVGKGPCKTDSGECYRLMRAIKSTHCLQSES
ncbi:hypothetical protein V1477_009238 [Vespula maculifrons]|uniref:Uncharacterized protein n=1 Tax=Vespula maculifrons TaxID=7453 RepID=A0ABD2CC66_VESMC